MFKILNYSLDFSGNKSCKPTAWLGSQPDREDLKSRGNCSVCRGPDHIESPAGPGVLLRVDTSNPKELQVLLLQFYLMAKHSMLDAHHPGPRFVGYIHQTSPSEINDLMGCVRNYSCLQPY